MKRLIMASALAYAACGAEPGNTPILSEPVVNDPKTAATVEPTFASGAPESAVSALVESGNVFAVSLYKAASGEPGNTIVGAVSVSAALALLYPGADGKTAQEIADVTGFDSVSAEGFAETMGTLLGTLETHIAPGEPGTVFDIDDRSTWNLPPDPAADLSIANAAWVKDSLRLQADYANTLLSSFAAPTVPIDFGDPVSAAARINGWVEERTNDRIKDLVPPDAIDPSLTAMILTNAVWFKANWADPFNPELTEDGTFTGRGGTEMPATMMADEMQLRLLERDGVAVAALPYSNPDFRLEVYLPGELEAFEAQLSPARLAELSRDLSALGTTDVDIRFPKFKVDGEIRLKPALQAMGLEAAFDPDRASFPRMIEGVAGDDLYVSDAFHKTFFQVDEASTEAAAATALVVNTESARLTRPFHVDRPFFTVLRHVPTDTVLFLGRIEEVEPFEG